MVVTIFKEDDSAFVYSTREIMEPLSILLRLQISSYSSCDLPAEIWVSRDTRNAYRESNIPFTEVNPPHPLLGSRNSHGNSITKGMRTYRNTFTSPCQICEKNFFFFY